MDEIVSLCWEGGIQNLSIKSKRKKTRESSGVPSLTYVSTLCWFVERVLSTCGNRACSQLRHAFCQRAEKPEDMPQTANFIALQSRRVSYRCKGLCGTCIARREPIAHPLALMHVVASLLMTYHLFFFSEKYPALVYDANACIANHLSASAHKVPCSKLIPVACQLK